jgi:FtsZ-interacting cell division protein ZipA
MSNTVLIVVIAVAIVAGFLAWMYLARQRRERLKTRFGPEYERAVRETGDARRAESVLETREKRVSKYEIRPLTAEQSRRFGEAWRAVQAKFVDDPAAAVTEGDLLVTEVMSARGYPMSDFDRRAEDLSVDHANVVHHYREARAIAARHSKKAASTEDLRQALVHYRALFEDLLEVHEPERRRA